jgi:arylsulfotransferase ASST
VYIESNDSLLLCARNTWSVYKVERKSEDDLWRLGGKKSDFEMAPGTQGAFQRDARRQRDGAITLFDNGAHPKVHDQSRGVVIELDEEKMSADLLSEYTSPEKLLSTLQGNMQHSPNASVFVGWGSELFTFEFSYDGKILFEAYLRFDGETYRAFRFPWSANLTEEPAVTAERVPEDEVKFYASWNGATEVAT